MPTRCQCRPDRAHFKLVQFEAFGINVKTEVAYETNSDLQLRRANDERGCRFCAAVYDNAASRPAAPAVASRCRTEFELLMVQKVHRGTEQITASEPVCSATIRKRRRGRCGQPSRSEGTTLRRPTDFVRVLS